MAHIATRCAQCGQTDDHPKVIAYEDGQGPWHHDCLSVDRRDELAAVSPIAAQIIAAAHDGKRGEELRTHILSLHATPEGA